MTLEQLPMSHYVKLSPCLVLKQSLAHFLCKTVKRRPNVITWFLARNRRVHYAIARLSVYHTGGSVKNAIFTVS